MKVKDAAMQAFPFIEPADDPAVKAYHPGISLRDYFAAKAMQGILNNVDPEMLFDTQYTSLTGMSYLIADAMMKARK